MAWLVDRVVLLATVCKYTFMVFAVDCLLPAATRRKLLAQEYTGDNLEKRLKIRVFKGWSTVKALREGGAKRRRGLRDEFAPSPRRRRDRTSEYPRGARGVAATGPRNVHAAPAAAPRSGLG